MAPVTRRHRMPEARHLAARVSTWPRGQEERLDAQIQSDLQVRSDTCVYATCRKAPAGRHQSSHAGSTGSALGYGTTRTSSELRARFRPAAEQPPASERRVLFWEDWKNFQSASSSENSFTIVPQRGLRAHQGAEQEIEWAVTPDFTLTAAATELDPKMIRTSASTPTRRPGVPFPLASCPAWTRCARARQLPTVANFKEI